MPFLLTFLFSLALFLPAALLFNIQPMVGKMLLPLVGGTPAVWNVAMAFFETALLVGYLVAHLLGRLPAFLHGLCYIACLLLALLFLPIALPPGWHPNVEGVLPLSIASALVTSVAVPFIALSLSAPTLQRLFSKTRHPRAHDPYFLYAASNMGSFTGLLAYPLYLEPHYALSEQASLWRAVFVGFIVLAGLAVVFQKLKAAPLPAPTDAPTAPLAPLTWNDKLWWMGLAFIPSSLTLGVTQYVSTDVAATPLLWVGTLGLYLLTFIVAFSQGWNWLKQKTARVFPFLGAAAFALIVAPLQSSWQELILHVATFGAGALVCHTLLSQRRPDARHLTAYYLYIAAGGALGGSFNAFIAPVLFYQLTEYPLMLALAMALASPLARDAGTHLFAGLVVAAFCFWAGDFFGIESTPLPPVFFYTLGVFTFASALFCLPVRKPLQNLLLMGLVGLTLFSHSLFVGRDFFGVIKVQEIADKKSGQILRTLSHGTTTHGVQIVSPQLENRPTGYYSSRSPIAQVFEAYQPQRVMITGLGSGGLNCFARPDHPFHFVEIDPLVVRVARQWFTFISACPPPRITIGDGRLVAQAEAQQGQSYDLIVLDAFSSDSIPTHLITKEAISLNLSLLNPGGLLAVHVSSRFFQLPPILKAIADDVGAASLKGTSTFSGVDAQGVHFPSIWVLLSRDAATLQRLRTRQGWQEIERDPGVRAWTDSYSNLWQAISFNGALLPEPSPSR